MSQHSVRVLQGSPTRGRAGDQPLLTLTVFRSNGWSVVEAVGEMDTQNVARLRALLQMSGPHVVLDLRCVTFMDASGLGVLATCAGVARRLGGAVRLVEPSRQVRRLLALTRMDQVLAVFESMEDALTATARTSRPGAD